MGRRAARRSDSFARELGMLAVFAQAASGGCGMGCPVSRVGDGPTMWPMYIPCGIDIPGILPFMYNGMSMGVQRP